MRYASDVSVMCGWPFDTAAAQINLTISGLECVVFPVKRATL